MNVSSPVIFMWTNSMDGAARGGHCAKVAPAGASRMRPDAHRMRPPAGHRPASAGCKGRIGKGKVHAPYEFGVKISVTATLNRSTGGQFALQAKAPARRSEQRSYLG
jgi:hypothetical protein